MTGEFSDLMLGHYGATAADKNPEVVSIAQEQSDKELISCRLPTSSTTNGTTSSQASKLKGQDGSDEDVLTYALFPQVAEGFFTTRDNTPHVGQRPAGQNPPEEQPAAAAPEPATSEQATPSPATAPSPSPWASTANNTASPSRVYNSLNNGASREVAMSRRVALRAVQITSWCCSVD